MNNKEFETMLSNDVEYSVLKSKQISNLNQEQKEKYVMVLREMITEIETELSYMSVCEGVE